MEWLAFSFPRAVNLINYLLVTGILGGLKMTLWFSINGYFILHIL